MIKMKELVTDIPCDAEGPAEGRVGRAARVASGGDRDWLIQLDADPWLTPGEARRLGRALLQHAARTTVVAGRNLTGDPGGSAVDTDGSTG